MLLYLQNFWSSQWQVNLEALAASLACKCCVPGQLHLTALLWRRQPFRGLTNQGVCEACQGLPEGDPELWNIYQSESSTANNMPTPKQGRNKTVERERRAWEEWILEERRVLIVWFSLKTVPRGLPGIFFTQGQDWGESDQGVASPDLRKKHGPCAGVCSTSFSEPPVHLEYGMCILVATNHTWVLCHCMCNWFVLSVSISASWFIILFMIEFHVGTW